MSDNPLSCTGRRALVIGCGTGIGFAAAEALIGAGAGVFLTGRRNDRLESAADRLRDRGLVGCAAGDARNAVEVERVVGQAVDFLGGHAGGLRRRIRCGFDLFRHAGAVRCRAGSEPKPDFRNSRPKRLTKG